jgi:endonuclease/exonuclease/phosphatase (EEP) superfamily protein YafD
MENIYVIAALWGLTGFFVLGTLAPLSGIRHGAIQGFAFPREQFFAFAIALMVGMYFVEDGTARWVGIGLLALVAAAQLVYIVKFTPLWPRQSVTAKGEVKAEKDRHVSVLASNVKMSNRDYGRLITLVKDKQPDILMAIEVDQPWIDALTEGVGDGYPHRRDVPRDTGYGLCLMSRLPLKDVEVREVITEGVPSIRAKVELRSGDHFKLYVVHPEPPVLGHDTLGRDGEIAQIGIEAEKDPLPAIVTGDLNDVAWSETTRRFQRLSGLLDPRVGRGFYNTFSATMPWMRWPLDHLFHDPKFRLVEMCRLPKIGSDHFPMWFVLALAETEKSVSEPGECDPEERKEVKEMIAEERDRDREPIGTDWELTD